MNWVDELLSQIHFADYYPQGKSTGPNQIIVNCPFHDDKHASLSINVATGMYYCHTCNEKGNFLTWAKKQNISLKKLAADHNIKTEEKKIDKQEINEMHKELLKTKSAITWLQKHRGYTMETIKKYSLGVRSRRYTIPIYDINGDIVNIRMYNPMAKKGEPKFASWKSGYGTSRLYPIQNLYKDPIMICEGEWDCILANQMGYNAITGTTGVGTFPVEWGRYFSGKKVLICYDIDEPGKTGAEKVARLLGKFAEAIKIIDLPIDINKIPTGDLTDYFMKEQHEKEDLDRIFKNAPLYEISSGDDKFYHVTLAEADHGKYNNKFIRTSALISGKDIEAYIIPKKIRATCTMNKGKVLCPLCPMSFENGNIKTDIQGTNKNILLLCNVTKMGKQFGLKEILQIPQRCDRVSIEEIESFNIEEVVLTTEIEYTTDVTKDEQFRTRRSYFVGHNIETNKSYDLQAKTIAHPMTQKATHLIFKATPSLTAIESYKFTQEMEKKLDKFRTDSIKEKIEDMYDNIIMHISGLKGREDLFTLILLTFCSPLAFNFQDKQIKKAYLESLVCGDTRTGKTEMMKSLIEYFKLGELVLGESATFAGLVGGLQQMGTRWHLTWGRIPLNNRRLVAVDEMSGLSIYEISKLSGIRSSGIAEITKIRTERTWARTRLVWMSNPRGSKDDNKRMLSSYSQGVRAIPELIGKPEDISRFDLVLLLGIDDVPMDLINTPIKTPETFKYTGEDFHDLIMFAWTLQPNMIKFTQDAIDEIYQCTKYLAFTYDQSIPLIVPSEERIKLAKIAGAVATMVFNYDGEHLVIDKLHVKFAYDFLCEMFNKPVCAYDEYSRLEKARQNILDREKIKDVVRDKTYVIDQLLEAERITQTDLQEIFDLDTRTETRKLLNTLLINKALKRISSGYEKTPAFLQFLRDHKNGNLFEDQEKIEDKNQTEDIPF